MAGVYHPSAQLTLALRVEELAEDDVLKRQLESTFTPTSPELDTENTADQVAKLNAELREILSEEESPERDERARAVRNKRDSVRIARRIPPSRACAVDGGSPDARFGRSGIIPVDCSIERNGFRDADTATITLNWKDVPFDPRIVRSAGVELTIGVVTPGDFAKGFAGQVGQRGLLLSTIDVAPGNKLPGSFTQFVGWVDDWAVSFGDDMDKVTLECRDYTALFLDTYMVQNDGIDLNLPLIEGIQQFIDRYPIVCGIPVIFGDVGESPRVVPGPPGVNIPPQQKARKGKRAQRKRSGNQRMTLWDHITDVTVAFGFVPIIRGYELRIINPRTRLSSKGTPRRMVFGRNLESLEFDRKLGANPVSIIELRAHNPVTDQVQWARWPVEEGQPRSGVGGTTDNVRSNRPPKAFPNVPTPSGAVVDEKVTIFTLDRTVLEIGSLEVLARETFEQAARQQIEGNFATADVAAWNIQKDEPLPLEAADLLNIVAGEPIELLVAPRDPRFPELTPNSTNAIAALPRESRAQYLMSLGYDSRVAEQISRLQEAAGYQTIFRVQNARIDMSNDEGLSIKADFINYITVREDAIQDNAPGDVEQRVANEPVSESLSDTLGGAEGEGPDAARNAQKERRVANKQLEEGSTTYDAYLDKVAAEKAAVRGSGGALGD